MKTLEQNVQALREEMARAEGRFKALSAQAHDSALRSDEEKAALVQEVDALR